MKLLFFALILAGLAFGYYYFFVDTLTLSEIAESTENSTAGFFATLMDFDTGLTRYDIHKLSSRAESWEARWRETESIPDRAQRRAEQDRLIDEMMSDPAFKKVSQRFGDFGEQSAREFMDMLSKY